MKNDNPLISIITVSLNSKDTIERTITSVINQTYKNIEYIVIDGGSSDGTIDIIKKYQDKISYWISEKDNGISDAFNKGIKKANGKIIGIINSDDWYQEDAIDTIVNLSKEKEADFYIGALNYWNKNKLKFTIYPDKNYKYKISFRMPHLNHPASFITKKTYEKIGLFNLRYKYAMDYDLFLRLHLNKKKGAFTKKIICNMSLGGTANLNNKKAYKEVFLISSNKTLGLIWYIISLTRRQCKILLNKLHENTSNK